ncbi:hypothetical protein L2E82_51983 [Cichorium intybus]|nr:hypothetical protein L2E82_51983 [Cichorium intybus]
MNGKTLKKLALKSFGSQKSVMVETLSIRNFAGFVRDTESVSSADDLENKDRIEDDRSLEPELSAEKYQEQEELNN